MVGKKSIGVLVGVLGFYMHLTLGRLKFLPVKLEIAKIRLV